MKLKKIFALVLCLSLIFSTMSLAVFATGEGGDQADAWDGTADVSWYHDADLEFTLTTAEELAGFAELVRAGNNFANKTIKLNADLDLKGPVDSETGNATKCFPPIGTGSNAFAGTFDGNFKTLSGIEQNGWYFGYQWGQYGSLGLFGGINGATIKNLTVKDFVLEIEGGDVAAIAGSAEGECTFENIKVQNCIVATYNNGCGGIIGWAGPSHYTFHNVEVDEDTVVAGLWGSFDSSLGGIMGQLDGGGSVDFENVKVACRLDAYNDVTASYKWYSYRMCGMLIGRVEDLFEDTTTVNPEKISCENVEVTFGEWANYTYLWDDTISRGCQRIESGHAYDGVNVADYPGGRIELIYFDTIFGGPQSQSRGYYGSGVDELEQIDYFADNTLEVIDHALPARSAAKINDDYYETLDAALAAANLMEGNVTIDLLDNTITINKAYVLSKDITFQNGTLSFDDYDGTDPETYNPAGVYDAVMTISDANITFDHVILSGNNSKATSGMFVLGANGAMCMKNGSVLNVSAPTAKAVIYSEESYDGKLVVKDSQINIDGNGNDVRGILAVELDADNAEISIKNLTDNAMRNVTGSVINSKIIIDGAEYGIKNTNEEVLAVTDSTILVKNTENESDNAGIYMKKREDLADSNSVIDAKIFVEENDVLYNTLTFKTNDGSKIPSAVIEENTVVDLSGYTPEKEGFVFGGWYADETLTEKINEITVDSCKTVYAKWNERKQGSSVDGLPGGGGGSGVARYTVVFETNGGSELRSVVLARNSKLDLSVYVSEKEGYVFEGWYTDAELTEQVQEISLTSNITLYAGWKEDVEKGKTPGDSEIAKFIDLDVNAWYYESVCATLREGLMNGVSETEFAPDKSLTRGMFVTILYRIEGTPEAKGDNRFIDMVEGQYYTDAVNWAAENGIVNGVGENVFAPDEKIIREQMAAIIYRYLEYKNVKAIESGEVTYTDATEIEEYALEAVRQMNRMGLLEGNTDGSFAPKRTTTRAEAAALFVRLLKVLQEK